MKKAAESGPNAPPAARPGNIRLCLNCDGVFPGKGPTGNCPYCASEQTVWLESFIRSKHGKKED